MKLMKRIPPIPHKGPSKPSKLADMVGRQNPKVYDGKYDPVEVE